MEKQQQLVRVFFGPDDPLGLNMPSEEERRKLVDRSNPKCAFSRFVGNEKAMKKLVAAAFDALGKPDHVCNKMSFALFGNPSCGKTCLAKLFAQVVQLPFVEVSPKMVKSMDDLFNAIERVLQSEGVPLVELTGRDYYFLPPCVIFLDEVHALSPSVVDGLLKPTEPKDRMMVTESGKTVNCANVTWMMATTDEGKLFDAFRTRFSSVNLKYLTKPEIARIVKLNHPEFSDEVCNLVAHYNSRIPRKALEFAEYMILLRQMDTKRSWAEVAREVATDEGIDEYGMHETHLVILKALGESPIAKNRIVNVAGRKIEEVERFIMPWLLTATEDSPALVTVSSRGYTITEAGLAELDRRKIAHKGKAALVRYSP